MSKRLNAEDIDAAIDELINTPEPPAEGSHAWKQMLKMHTKAVNMGYKKGIVRLGMAISAVYMYARKFKEAKKYLQQMISLYKGQKELSADVADALLMTAEIESFSGNHAKSIALCEEVERNYIAHTTAKQLMLCYITMGNTYANEGKMYQALHSYQKVLAKRDELSRFPHFMSAWMNYANVLLELKLYERAEKELLEIQQDNSAYTPAIEKAYVHLNLANVYADGAKDEKKSREHTKLFLKVCDEHEIDIRGIGLFCFAGNLARFEKYKEALKVLDEKQIIEQYTTSAHSNLDYNILKARCILNTAEWKSAAPLVRAIEKEVKPDTGVQLKIAHYHNMLTYYTLSGDAKKALQYQKLHTDTMVEFSRIETAMQVQQLTTLMEVEKKEKELTMERFNKREMEREIEFAKQEKALLQANIDQRNTLIAEFESAITKIQRSDMRRSEIFKSLNEKIKAVKYSSAEVDKYDARFNEKHSKQVAALLKQYPSITHGEAKIAVMLVSGLSNKEIANITLTTTRNVETHRLQLRKKLALQKGEDLLQKLKDYLEA